MKKIFLLTILSLGMTSVFAQDENNAAEAVTEEQTTEQSATEVHKCTVGYFSYNEVLEAMPDYATVNDNIKKLSDQYDEELKSAQKEFTEKYEYFLENQRAMNSAIRDKRQSELQNLLDRNVAFRDESQRLLVKARQSAMAPLHDKLQEALNQLAGERGFIMVVNTDSDACPYINPASSEDITSELIELTK